MKILHVSYSDSIGGASIATMRIHKNLLKKKIESKLLVLDKNINDKNIFGPNKSFDKIFNDFKISLARYLNRKITLSTNRGSLSFNYFNTNYLNKINKIESDIVHLHWIGNEMISISQLKKINKPIVWSFWDMWPINGAEHYSDNLRNVEGYKKSNRPSNEKGLDINKFIWKHKLKNFDFKINVICPSKWLMEKVNKSKLFIKSNINYIPLSIDTEYWKKLDKKNSRNILNLPLEKNILLFSSTSGTNDRKGFKYLVDALNQIQIKDVLLVIFGEKPKNLHQLKIKSIYLGKFYDKNTIKMIYSAADLIIMPSILEVFGQVALEGASCSLPSVIFENTGCTDLIKHKKNGYIAKNRDILDLRNGIEWCLNSKENLNMISENARNISESNFSDEVNINKLIDLYKSIN